MMNRLLAKQTADALGDMIAGIVAIQMLLREARFAGGAQCNNAPAEAAFNASQPPRRTDFMEALKRAEATPQTIGPETGGNAPESRASVPATPCEWRRILVHLDATEHALRRAEAILRLRA